MARPRALVVRNTVKMPGIARGREKGYPTTKVESKVRPARSVGVSAREQLARAEHMVSCSDL